MVNAATRSEARIKQLSCLGLGGEAIMPALFHELAELIPSYSSSFFFSDERGQVANIYEENQPVDILDLHVQEFVNRREKDVSLDFTEQVNTCVGVLGPEHVLKVDPSTFERSDLYNLILRQIGCHDFIRLVVRNHGHPLGILSLHRPVDERPFTTEDRRRLASLESFIAHAMTERRKIDWRLVDSEKSSLIIADTEGRLIHSTAEGRKLLLLANYPWITEGCA